MLYLLKQRQARRRQLSRHKFQHGLEEGRKRCWHRSFFDDETVQWIELVAAIDHAVYAGSDGVLRRGEWAADGVDVVVRIITI